MNYRIRPIRPIRPIYAVLSLWLCALVALLPLLTLPTPAPAANIEYMTLNGMAQSGFTHRATIYWYDLTNAAAGEKSVQLFPRTGSITTNYLIGPVAFFLTQPFTNSGGATMTNLMLTLGFDGTATTGLGTNQFTNPLGIDIDGRGSNAVNAVVSALGPTYVWSTNLMIPLTVTTNFLSAHFSQRGTLPTLSTCNRGQIDIYFRAVDLGALRRQ